MLKNKKKKFSKYRQLGTKKKNHTNPSNLKNLKDLCLEHSIQDFGKRESISITWKEMN